METRYGPTYTIDLAPDEESLLRLEGYKLMGKQKKDTNKQLVFTEDGTPVFKFKRAKFATWNDKATGKLTQKDRGAPAIVNMEGAPLDPALLLGNGSVVTVKLSLRDSKMGPSLRLEKVAVVDLVPFGNEVVEDNPDNLPF
jgi:hypothetical protein